LGPALPGGPVVGQAVLIGASALLATLPDIDEPGSFIGRRVRIATSLAGAGAAGWLAFALALPIGLAVLLLAVGIIGGGAAGYGLVLAIRRAAGGHRRLTHSLVLAGALAALAGALWLGGLRTEAIVPAALAWGIVVHNLGDVVTPAGVPLLYPFSRRDVRVLPRPVSRYGETLAATVAVGIAVLLLRMPV
jgi:membrane-bound metal-dependent hydrolase YbcI (DUF457 family)